MVRLIAHRRPTVSINLPSTLPADLSRRIKAERERLRAAALAADKRSTAYTTRWVAGMLGVTQGAYCDLEHPRGANPSAVRLTELAALGYDVRRILAEAFALRRRGRPPKAAEADAPEPNGDP